MYLMYLRKSRADGEHETVEEVLAKHYKMLQDYAAVNLGGAIPEDRIYREVVSGETIQDRPEMNKVLFRIQNDKISGVLVVEPQRLSRGDLSDCGTIVRAFRYTDTLIVTPTKTYDLSEKYDRKFFEMELMRGNDYLEYIKEIMMRGRTASTKAGNYIGSIPPYGYSKAKIGKEHTLVPNPQEADVLRLIYDLWVNEGLGCTAIAHRLDSMHIKPRNSKLWYHASIQSMLKNPVYIGKIQWNSRKTIKKYENGIITSSRPINKEDAIIVEGKHEPLISEELYYASLNRFGKIPKTKPSAGLINPFAGILHCSCGRAMVYQVLKKCSNRLVCSNQVHCNNRSALYDEVEAEVLLSLKKCAADIQEYINEDNISKVSETQKAIIANLKKELESLESQQTKLYEFLEKGIYTTEIFLQRNGALAKRRHELEEAIEESQAQTQCKVDYENRYVALIEAINALENKSLDAKLKNRLLRTVIKDITYSRIDNTNNKYNKYHQVPFTLDISLL